MKYKITLAFLDENEDPKYIECNLEREHESYAIDDALNWYYDTYYVNIENDEIKKANENKYDLMVSQFNEKLNDSMNQISLKFLFDMISIVSIKNEYKHMIKKQFDLMYKTSKEFKELYTQDKMVYLGELGSDITYYLMDENTNIINVEL